MIAGIFLAQLASAPQTPDIQWAKVSHSLQLIDVVDDDGVGVLNEDHVLTILDPDGKSKKTIKVPAGKDPLYYWTGHGLSLAPRHPISMLGDDGEEAGWNGSRLEFFAQGSRVFAVTSGVSYIEVQSTCSLTDYDEYSCVGINPEGDTIAQIHTSMLAPSLDVYRKLDRDWFKDSFLKTPGNPDYGMIHVVAGCNDLRFIGKDMALFIGHLLPPATAELQDKLKQDCIDLTRFSIDWMKSGKYSTRYLIVMRLGSGYCRPVAKLSIEQRLERGVGLVGRFTVSQSGKWIYLLTSDSVLRMSVADLLKQAGMD